MIDLQSRTTDQETKRAIVDFALDYFNDSAEIVNLVRAGKDASSKRAELRERLADFRTRIPSELTTGLSEDEFAFAVVDTATLLLMNFTHRA